MQRDDSVYLKHIRDSIAKIQAYTKGVNKASFLKDTLVQDAVIRQIEIVGEAAKRLSEGIRSQHSDVPWQDISGMRNKLVHDWNSSQKYILITNVIPARLRRESRQRILDPR